jgi:hypothetical protein
MATGIRLQSQSSNPLGLNQKGIWINNSGDLINETGGTAKNITQSINNLEGGGSISTISRTYLNNSGSTIPVYTPVYLNAAGQIAPAINNNATQCRVIGVTLGSISNGNIGQVALYGTIDGVAGYTHGAYIYLGATAGQLVDTAPVSPPGTQVVKVGIMDGTTLILQIQHIGVLS